MTLVEARNAVVGLQVEESCQSERILNLVQVHRRHIYWDLIPEETEISLGDQMRILEQDERENINVEHGRATSKTEETMD
jgi:hypothetical protein